MPCNVPRPQNRNFRWGLDIVKEYQNEVPFWYTGQCPLVDNDVAILTNAGGPGILAADQLDESQFKLTSVTDVLGDAVASKFKRALNHLAGNNKTDAILVIISPQTNTQLDLTAKYIVEQFKNSSKPIVVSLLGGDSIQSATEILRKGGVATIEYPKKAIVYLKTLYDYYHHTCHHRSSYPTRSATYKKLLLN